MNSSPALRYFHNRAATVLYVPAGYIRLDWQPATAAVAELRAVYEHTLQAMLHHKTGLLMTVHNNRPPIPQDVQQWLVAEWVPRAMATAGYRRCAVVEGGNPLSRLAARSIGSSLQGPLAFGYYDTTDAAEAWLLS